MYLSNLLKSFRKGLRTIYAQFFSPLDRTKYGHIGTGSLIMNNSHLMPQNIYASDWSIIQNNLNFISNKGKLYLGKYSVISSDCIIVPESHKLTVGVPFYLSTIYHINDEVGNIIIEEDCWIGTGCILLPNCHIGRGVVVGAGSVVNKQIPPYAVVAGVPAKIIATKFSIDEILKHEAILYTPEERMSKKELESLFSSHYQGLKSIGSNNQDEDLMKYVNSIRNKIGMIDFSNL